VSLRARWQAAASLVARTRDVLDARPGDPRWQGDGGVPAALASRGWAPHLLALSDARVEALEARGLDADWDGAPPSLAAMLRDARAVCAMPSLGAEGATRPARRLETPRKRAQIDAFAEVILPLAARATRVVDVGSGHGHLTREIAARIAMPVVGLERDAALASRARALPSPGATAFAVTDVLREGLTFSAGDCAIGLHACGELGDAMVESVGRVEGDARVSIALVGCCLQKRRAASRRPLVRVGEDGQSREWVEPSELAALESPLELPRPLLGLSNLTARDEGVEATRAENVAARERRLALHRLLSVRVGALRLGAEIDGLNRRVAHGDLSSLVARAFAHRGLAMPSTRDIEVAAAWARTEHPRARRLSLPRSMLARVLEVFVLLDRAVYLEDRGFTMSVGTVFASSVSARNLGLVGSR